MNPSLFFSSPFQLSPVQMTGDLRVIFGPQFSNYSDHCPAFIFILFHTVSEITSNIASLFFLTDRYDKWKPAGFAGIKCLHIYTLIDHTDICFIILTLILRAKVLFFSSVGVVVTILHN